ncbi:hypothetical protein CO251_11470 [Sulfobacillus sp. hq2]|nr:hypothetical protein CO251_11470 [Sulfobacillus sp. hq2]
MSCYSYVFVGHVHPIAANVTLASQDFAMSLPSEDRPIQGTLNITHSAIWRAGGEATMSRLKRKYGLRRSRYRGYDAEATGIGLGIFAHNVRRWAQRQAG